MIKGLIKEIEKEFTNNNINFDNSLKANYIDDSFGSVMICIENAVKKLMLTDVGVPKETLCDKPETNKEGKYYARWTKNSKPEDFAQSTMHSNEL